MTRYTLIAFSLFTIIASGFTQDCQLPIITVIDSPTTDGFTVHWIDNNSDVLNYEMEIGSKGFTRTFLPNVPAITTDSLQLTNLLSGTTYEIYLRSICSIDISSAWNGPYFYNTIIDNNNSCDLLLDIPDNNCPESRDYLIQVSLGDDLILGQDYNIQSLNINIEHTWPPDLQLSITAPSGETALLSRYNGNGRDNYGSLLNNDCTEMAVFTDDACQSIDDYTPPLLGEFRPTDNLRNTFNGINASGIWTLKVCDRARGDIGQIRAVKLNFIEGICLAPEDYTIDDIEADNISVSWRSSSDCSIYKIAYRIANAPLPETSFDFIECNENDYVIEDLIPDTEYVMTITTRCNNGVESSESCETYFRTACANSSFTSSFNNSEACNISCDDRCLIDSIWYNLSSKVNAWNINSGATPSEFTGPSGDINNKGNYIYIENSNTSCHTDTVILQSKCLELNANTSCQLSFNYHMYGGEITKLELQQNNQEKGWMSIWEKEGNQDEEWISESLSLAHDFEIGQLRFVAYRSANLIRNDIALDQIKLIGLDTVQLRKYYADVDGDTYGDPRNFRLLCSSEPPVGFSLNNEDCDDENPNINPGATEIFCNLSDENCNGSLDENQPSDIIYEVLSIDNETCKGRSDGNITISASNGQEPYTYLWSNGATSSELRNIASGIYTCTISDFGTCQIVTEPIFVDFNDIINYSLLSIIPPSCQGRNDGTATLLISGGIPPYDIDWGNGITGSQVNNLVSGDYIVTISDGSSCSIETDPISVTSSQLITAGVALKRDIDCSGDSNGIIQLGINGGMPPYTIEWSNGMSTPTITQLSEGSYNVTITDQSGCNNIIEDITVDEPEKLNITINNKEDVNCPNDNTGMIDVSVGGGTAPYSYFWSNGQRTEDLISIRSGSYSMTVTDINACVIVIEDIIIAEPDPISIEVDNIINVNCPSSTDGFIMVNTSGGQPIYTYNWSITDGIESEDNELSQLNSGLYSLTVVDQFGCKSDPLFFEIVNRNRAINIESTTLSPNLCFGDSTAAIVAEVRNGVSPFDYNWSNGDRQITDISMDTIDNLIANSYNLTVTDSEGCTGVSDAIILNEPNEVTYDVIQAVENKCWYDNQGTIELEPQGGSGNLNITWSNGTIGSINNQLSNGEYQATITDDNNCTEVTNLISITSHPAITIDAIIQNTDGADGTIDITTLTGLTPFTYTWNGPLTLPPASIIENLIPGEYQLSIEDREGCILDTIFTVQLISSIDFQEKIVTTIYPNPGIGSVTLLSNHNIIEVKVYDVNGREITITTLSKNKKEIDIDINAEMNGVYYIKISTEYGTELLPYLKLNSF